MNTQTVAMSTEVVAAARGIGLDDYFSGWVPAIITITTVLLFGAACYRTVAAFFEDKIFKAFLYLIGAGLCITLIVNFQDVLDMIGQNHKEAVQHKQPAGGPFHQHHS